jgi:hypothetical protein
LKKTTRIFRARTACRSVLTCFLSSLLFGLEDGGNNFFRNVGKLLPNYTASSFKKHYSSFENLKTNNIDTTS